jgi:hypothetical protein
MRRLLYAALAATCLITSAHAQSSASGPLVTPSGTLEFARTGSEFTVMLDEQVFDRFSATALVHFDETEGANDAITRTLVQTGSGPVVYDFRRRPPLVQRAGQRVSIKRVFWQRDEVVMQGPQGWFRLKGGVLTRLQSSTTTYH